PKHIDRSSFFNSFVELLKSNGKVSKLNVIENTYVPIIQLNFDNVDIDLLFARINSFTVNDQTALSDHNILKNLDVRCVKSLNGCRVTDEILNLVPNHSSFRTCLRAIKLWAD
ncbi:MAG: hypothetical protein MHPSP_004775, partial [Paramarteilia canceri]